MVIRPGDEAAYRAAAGPHGRLLQFVEQSHPLGYGHAARCARAFTGTSPFLLLVGDHLYLSRSAKRCAQQLVETAAAEACTVSAVQATHESKLPHYGTVGGRLAGVRPGFIWCPTWWKNPRLRRPSRRSSCLGCGLVITCVFLACTSSCPAS